MRRYCLLFSLAGILIASNAWADSVIDAPWPMYHIDRQFYNHNSLSPGDVDRDGHLDYCVIHEGPDVYTILFHPGEGGNLCAPWKKVTVGGGGNVEYAYLGDLDGDGCMDVAGAEGHKKRHRAGIRILWGPAKDRVKQSDAWQDGGFIPGTIDQGHYLFCECHDINGDGALDIVVGGRVLQTNQSVGGLKWIEAPKAKKDRRNLATWKVHDIDANLLSGHGFEWVDVDQDGDKDFIVNNADWDTPDNKDALLWYVNPGNGKAAQRKPWPRQTIYKNLEYFAKAQVAIGDVNKDGLIDAVTQTDNRIIMHLKKTNGPVSWEHKVIQKPAATRWVTRPIDLVDLNQDGKLDIVGMLIHNFGNTPKGKAAVFWMEYEGSKPGTDNWRTHVIKWSDGVNSGKRYTGEKWDHCRFVDIDGDGDLDIMANCEEHYHIEKNKRVTDLGVVWFENKLNEG